jgi:hypothetical protein
MHAIGGWLSKLSATGEMQGISAGTDWNNEEPDEFRLAKKGMDLIAFVPGCSLGRISFRIQ